MSENPLAALTEFEVVSDINPDADPELFAVRQPKSFMWGYWRKADGEICASPNWPSEYMQRVDEGWTSLRKYGEFVLQQTGWNVTREPFRLIFMNGGAKEFSPEQIVSHNWHKRPPYKGIKFPQLDMDFVADTTCKFCRKSFSSYSEESGEARALVEANLARHESVSHKDSSQNAGLARALREGLDPKQAATMPSGDLNAILQQLATSQDLILQLLAQRETPTRSAVAAPPRPPIAPPVKR